jgi:threonine synthase
MIDDGKIDKNDTTICYVTGNGLKATEALMEVLPKPEVMQADIAKISAVVK